MRRADTKIRAAGVSHISASCGQDRSTVQRGIFLVPPSETLYPHGLSSCHPLPLCKILGIKLFSGKVLIPGGGVWSSAIQILGGWLGAQVASPDGRGLAQASERSGGWFIRALATGRGLKRLLFVLQGFTFSIHPAAIESAVLCLSILSDSATQVRPPPRLLNPTTARQSCCSRFLAFRVLAFCASCSPPPPLPLTC